MNNPGEPAKYAQQLDDDDIGGFGIREVTAIVVERWPVLAAAIFVGALYGAYRGWVEPPIYAASALVEVETRSSGFAFGADVFSAAMSPAQPLATQMEILKSASVLSEAISELKLDIVAEPIHHSLVGAALARTFRGKELASPPFGLDRYARYAWGGEFIRVIDFKVPERFTGLPFRIRVESEGEYSLFGPGGQELGRGRVGQESSGPLLDEEEGWTLFVGKLRARPQTEFMVKVQRMRNAVASLRGNLRLQQRGDTSNFGGSTILVLTVQSGDPISAMAASNAVAETYLRQNVERLSEQAQKRLEFLDSQLPRIRTELRLNEEALLEHRTQNGSLQLSDSAQGLLDSMTALEHQVSSLELERSEMLGVYTTQHPLVESMDRKLKQLKTDRSRLTTRLSQMPDAEIRLLQLSRDAEVAKQLYLALLNKSQELRIAKAGTIGNVRIIDKAIKPEVPIAPNRGAILGQWVSSGFAAGLALILLLHLLRTSVDSPDEVERKVGIPVFATIPHSKHQAQIDRRKARRTQAGRLVDRLLAQGNPNDVALEGIRSLRATLYFAMLEAKNCAVAVTGPSPGVGKTFIATNLSTVIAEAGKRTLLVDADLRRGRVHASVGLNRSPGLSDVIASEVPFEAVIRKLGPNLDVVTTGKLPPNPAELLANQRFGEFVEAMVEEYDTVIIDAPPVMNLADALTIARWAGTNFMVVRAQRTGLKDLTSAIKRLRQNGIAVDGLIFNDLRATLAGYVREGYGYYKNNYYQYSYAPAPDPADDRT